MSASAHHRRRLAALERELADTRRRALRAERGAELARAEMAGRWEELFTMIRGEGTGQPAPQSRRGALSLVSGERDAAAAEPERWTPQVIAGGRAG